MKNFIPKTKVQKLIVLLAITIIAGIGAYMTFFSNASSCTYRTDPFTKESVLVSCPATPSPPAPTTPPPSSGSGGITQTAPPPTTPTPTPAPTYTPPPPVALKRPPTLTSASCRLGINVFFALDTSASVDNKSKEDMVNGIKKFVDALEEQPITYGVGLIDSSIIERPTNDKTTFFRNVENIVKRSSKSALGLSLHGSSATGYSSLTMYGFPNFRNKDYSTPNLAIIITDGRITGAIGPATVMSNALLTAGINAWASKLLFVGIGDMDILNLKYLVTGNEGGSLYKLGKFPGPKALEDPELYEHYSNNLYKDVKIDEGFWNSHIITSSFETLGKDLASEANQLCDDGAGLGGDGEGIGPSGTGQGEAPGVSVQPVASEAGSGGGTSATTTADEDNSVPTAAEQGSQEAEQNVKPDPFFDGKQYDVGSLVDDLTTLATSTSKKLVNRWYMVIGSIVGGALIGTGWWYVRRRR